MSKHPNTQSPERHMACNRLSGADPTHSTNKSQVPVLDTLNQIEKLMCYCEFSIAEKAIRGLLRVASALGDRLLHDKAAELLNECRRHDILSVLRSLNSIRQLLNISLST